MRKFQIKVDDKVYKVEVEEVGGNEPSARTIPVPQPVATKVKEDSVNQKVSCAQISSCSNKSSNRSDSWRRGSSAYAWKSTSTKSI